MRKKEREVGTCMMKKERDRGKDMYEKEREVGTCMRKKEKRERERQRHVARVIVNVANEMGLRERLKGAMPTLTTAGDERP